MEPAREESIRGGYYFFKKYFFNKKERSKDLFMTKKDDWQWMKMVVDDVDDCIWMKIIKNE